MRVEAVNLTKVYPSGTKALRGLSLKLASGEIHTIIGPNGAGKTTFLRLVTGELSPTSGRLLVNDKSSRLPRTCKMGVMPQNALLYRQLTVWEHVYFFTRLKGMTRRESAAETSKFLSILGLDDRRTAELTTLSGGMLQTVNLAQALTGDPELLILDEPTAGLDPARRCLVWSFLRGLKGKTTILLTTQYLDDVRELGDTVTVINCGDCVLHGGLNEFQRLAGYSLRVEVPQALAPAHLERELSARYSTSRTNSTLVLWADDLRVLDVLSEAGVDLSTVTVERPRLEEAYLNLVAEGEGGQ